MSWLQEWFRRLHAHYVNELREREAFGFVATAHRCNEGMGIAGPPCVRKAHHQGPHCGVPSMCDDDTHNDGCSCPKPWLDRFGRCVCGGFP